MRVLFFTAAAVAGCMASLAQALTLDTAAKEVTPKDIKQGMINNDEMQKALSSLRVKPCMLEPPNGCDKQ